MWTWVCVADTWDTKFINTLPDSLIIASHLEMGDAVICNGMVRYFAAKHRRVTYLTRAHYAGNVRAMYSDLKNVMVLSVADYDEMRARWLNLPGIVRLGFFNPPFSTKDFDKEFYRQAGVSYEEKYRSFKLPPALLPKTGIARPRVFLHQDERRGYIIDRTKLPKFVPVTRVGPSKPFWAWLVDLCSAKEIHVIDSVWLNVVEALYFQGVLKADKLVWHYYARREHPPALRAPWRIL